MTPPVILRVSDPKISKLKMFLVIIENTVIENMSPCFDGTQIRKINPLA